MNGSPGVRLRTTLQPARTAQWLLAIAVVLTALHVLAMLSWYLDWLPVDEWLYYSFFDLDEEESFGTWFSSLLLLAASLISFVAANSDAHRRRWWAFLGCGFIVLSIDEIAGFHEFVNTMVEATHWTTFGIGLVLLVGLAYLPFLLGLPARTRNLLLVAGALYVGGAVGVERATIWHETNDMLDTLEYNLTTALEEFLEMGGIVLYVYTLLDALGPSAGRTVALSLELER